jgi:uncharacterized damage-inducible protein DinB
MITESPYFRKYLFTALEAQPALFERALAALTAEEADRRPDPERFSIREAVAHIADWEEIFLERMRRICEEDHPTLPGYDEGVLAVERDYASRDPVEQLARYREGRKKMVSFLRDRPASEWQRTADRPEIGTVTLEALAIIVTLHDTYHLEQVSEWRWRKLD